MQLEESSARSPRDGGERQGVSPVKAFLVLLALAVAAGLVLMFMTPVTVTEHPSATTPTSKPDSSLTNAEAIARFKQLKTLRDRAYLERDTSLVRQVYTSDSPARSIVVDELRLLAKREVVPKTTFTTKSLHVLDNSRHQIAILQEVVVRPRFVTESGKDITRTGRIELQTVRWILRPDNGNWLVHKTVIASAKSVGKPNGR